ncbi:endoplasmic reticulum aminopeptidase 1-like [Physella acuta]|uniref:endoplasmic reticulum aminopeptidase 1-like n=1 Tax=Physella acuta TaxID=109671 RepID=UPI0027DCC237|nr:endoplasmic reticulum aminopeptidase 1-like [Physella acuta]
MPQDGETSDWNTGLVSTKFQRSPKMSTYLVCFVICDFNYTETRTRSGVPIRVFAAPDRIEQTLYSLDLANFTLEKFQELFNMSYPLPKLGHYHNVFTLN